MATTQHYLWAGGHFVLLISTLRYFLVVQSNYHDMLPTHYSSSSRSSRRRHGHAIGTAIQQTNGERPPLDQCPAFASDLKDAWNHDLPRFRRHPSLLPRCFAKRERITIADGGAPRRSPPRVGPMHARSSVHINRASQHYLTHTPPSTLLCCTCTRDLKYICIPGD